MNEEKYYCWNTHRWLKDSEEHRECLKKKHDSSVYGSDHNKAGFSRVQIKYYSKGELDSVIEGDDK